MQKRVITLVALFLTSIPSFSSEKEYDIVRYDNLWNIAEDYLGDGFAWESIWELNQYIKNPDLIYPDDILIIPGYNQKIKVNDLKNVMKNTPRLNTFDDKVISLFDIKDTAEVDTTTAKEIPLTSKKKNIYSSLMKESVIRTIPYLYTKRDKKGIIAPGEATITDNSKQVYHLFNEVEITLDKNSTFTIGDEVDICKEVKFIKYRNDVANLIQPVAIGKIISLNDTTGVVKVLKTWELVRNEYKIVHPLTPEDLPNYNNMKQVEVEEVEADVVSHISGKVTIHLYEDIIINRGSEDGIKQGDIFSAYGNSRESGNGSVTAIVLKVNENSASIKVTNMSESLRSKDLKFIRTSTLQ